MATVAASHVHDLARRASSSHSSHNLALEDRFEVLKEIGDGSFGSVVLARVRSAGASVARRGTVVSSISEYPDFPPRTSIVTMSHRSPSRR